MTEQSITKSGFNAFLNKIRSADERQVKAQFDIATILRLIKEHKLYHIGEHESFEAMVLSELDFNLHTAMCYTRLHKNFERYKYTKTEFFKLMKVFGWREVDKCLAEARRKMGVRAMQNFIDARDSKPSHQYNFLIKDEQVCVQLETILERFGSEKSAEGGRRSKMTEAFVCFLEYFDKLDAQGIQMSMLPGMSEEESEQAIAKRGAAAQAAYVKKSNAKKVVKRRKKADTLFDQQEAQAA